MSKVVCPLPQREPTDGLLPDAGWWRLCTTGRNEDGYLYVMTRDGGEKWEDATLMTVEWFDGYDAILDAGLDRINLLSMYMEAGLDSDGVVIDLLCEHQPTPQARRITRAGCRRHPNDFGGRR